MNGFLYNANGFWQYAWRPTHLERKPVVNKGTMNEQYSLLKMIRMYYVYSNHLAVYYRL